MTDRKAYYEANPDQREKARQRAKRWRAANKEHHQEASRAWRLAHPERQAELVAAWKAKHPLAHTHRYGLWEEEYEALLEAQEGHCYFCPSTTGDSTGRRLVVDHDHLTGRVRGLLCYGCNMSLGFFERGQRSRLPEAKTREYLGIPKRPPPRGGGPAV